MTIPKIKPEEFRKLTGDVQVAKARTTVYRRKAAPTPSATAHIVVGSIEKTGEFSWSAIVLGELASKSNSRKIVRFGQRYAMIKSDKARAYVKAFLQQVPRVSQAYTGLVSMTAVVYYADQRSDLDIGLLQDCLQNGSDKHPMTNIIHNDRQIREIHAFHRIDKLNPRVEVTLRALKPVGVLL